ncbi:MAG: hypothetical protein LBE38_06020 [Deltaproteobacteria bacterium]|nr:hypothetical protein [Deltaproteobacteria bacterium]
MPKNIDKSSDDINSQYKTFYQKFIVENESVKLWILAFLVSVVLCGSEATHYRIINVVNPDQFNTLVISAGARDTLSEGQIIPRTSPILLYGDGYPIHQFYSPLSHIAIALVSFIFRDLILGYVLTIIFMMSLAFVYSWKLTKYLTFSNIIAAVGAFLFITGPYLSTDRVLRGAIPEYFAFCLFPMVLYYTLRAVLSKKMKYIVFAFLSICALLLSHTIMSTFFYFFGFIFLLLYLIVFLIKQKFKNVNTKNNFVKKCFILFLLAITSLLVTMVYLYPIIFYNDLSIKYEIYNKISLMVTSYHVPILSLLSIRDSTWLGKHDTMDFGRFQIGFMLYISYSAYIYFYWKFKESTYFYPTVITASFILFLIVFPIIFIGPLNSLKVVQFSYRFIAFFQLLATIMGPLALREYFRRNQKINQFSKQTFASVIIISSMILVIPYINQSHVTEILPVKVNSSFIHDQHFLYYGNDGYMRVAPSDNDSSWVSDGTIIIDDIGNSKEKLFTVDLLNYYEMVGKKTDLYLNVLYYPGLMDVQVFVDGIPYNAELKTFWQKRNYSNTDGKNLIINFHGLLISDLPDKGIIFVTTTFTGSTIGNLISTVSILGILIFLLFFYIRKRNKNKIS